MLNGKIEYGILIKANNEMSVVEITEPLYECVGKLVDGYIEHLSLRNTPFKEDYCLICDEEFLCKDKRPAFNATASAMYAGTLLGDVVFLKDGMRDGEPDIIGLELEEACDLVDMFKFATAEMLKDPVAKEYLESIDVDKIVPVTTIIGFNKDDDKEFESLMRELFN